jgi:hypothetical protein
MTIWNDIQAAINEAHAVGIIINPLVIDRAFNGKPAVDHEAQRLSVALRNLQGVIEPHRNVSFWARNAAAEIANAVQWADWNTNTADDASVYLQRARQWMQALQQ